MSDFEYGPIEIFLIAFTGERPGPDVVDAMTKLMDSGVANLLDLVFVSRNLEGGLTVLEIDELKDQPGFSGLPLKEVGLIGEHDIAKFAEEIPPGTSAAALVIEHVWVKDFATALYAAGGELIGSERITAPVVNELIASLKSA